MNLIKIPRSEDIVRQADSSLVYLGSYYGYPKVCLVSWR